MISLLLALLLQPPPGFFYVERVVDGDTIVVRDIGTVRLLGVDTPETVDPRRPMGPCGRAASDFTKGMLTHKYIALESFSIRRTFRSAEWPGTSKLF